MAKHGEVKDKTWGSLGGGGHMFPFAGTSKQEPGQAAQEGRSGGRRGIAPQAGGDVAFVSDNSKKGREMSAKHGTNTDYAGTQQAGTSGPTKSGGDKNGFAKGGTTHMWGNRGSRRSEPGCSSPC